MANELILDILKYLAVALTVAIIFKLFNSHYTDRPAKAKELREWEHRYIYSHEKNKMVDQWRYRIPKYDVTPFIYVNEEENWGDWSPWQEKERPNA